MGMEGRNNITGGVVMGEVYYPPPHPYAVAQGFPMNNNNPSAPLEPPPPPPPSQGFDMNNNGYVPPPPPPPQGFATSNNNTSCAPPPPAVSVANTNVYVNTEERVKGYAVAVAVAEPGLPCCGIGVGWTLWIAAREQDILRASVL
ncbi:hypothetical protein JCGZ_25065 [Jatropha curcas]|uniref:Uncharacterized protein n=1 Tax=Jatropha curcas TaxID=180498 RepID=A0A067JKI8_JATCU|nr:hypothetical protein JCGZ_25065 [Jatropha curcas]